MIKRCSFLFLLFTFFTLSISAQVIREISKDPADFPEEIIRMTKSISDRDKRLEAEEFSEEFIRMWQSDTLTAEKQQEIIATLNTLLGKRFLVEKVVFNYLTTIHTLAQLNDFDQNFQGLHKGLDYFIRRLPRNQVEDVITRLHNFSLHRELTSQRSATWKSTADSFKIQFDEKDRSFSIQIPKTDLIAYAYEDSSIIYNTAGEYDLRKQRWFGNGGIVTWENAGMDPDQVYASFQEYDINMRVTKYRVDNANFFYKKYFSEPLIGRLSNQTEVGSTTKENSRNVNYPRFVVSEGQKTIENIFPDIDYTGGFSMLGNRLVASSSKKSLASIIMNHNGKPFMELKSPDFAMDSSKIKSRLASVVIYLDEDSIYHPAIRFTYDDQTKMLSLYRDQEGLSRSPFFDSYHMVDIDVEALFWKVGSEKVRLQNIPSASGSNRAYFRSMNFFDEGEFAEIKGMDQKNPLYRVHEFYNEMGMKEFDLKAMVDFMGYSPHMVKAMLLNLANRGFLTYDLNNDKVQIRERLFHYLEARQGARDYDVINFTSSTQQNSNAELSLLDYNLALNGVRNIQLSDSQNVVINPKNYQVRLKKNRDFEFDGMVKAGRFVIHGEKFVFSYADFAVEMPLVDSLQFWVKPFEEHKDKYRNRKYVESVIQGFQGELLIDNPNNKSGRQSFPKFPILSNEKNAYVYYDKNCVHRNVYKNDEFYYRLDPFTIDSLDDFSTEGLQFSGYLASGGIFPVIEHPLAVQKDYSLGFTHETPSEGYNIYGGKGHYKNTISLSNQGLEGDGSLKYLTAEVHSQEFDFFPDSTNALAYDFTVESQQAEVQYPSVEAKNIKVHWEPHEDLMTAENQEELMNLFDEQAKMDGVITYTPKQMTGKGLMGIADAEITSELFHYTQQDINADTCNFKLNSKGSEFGLGAGDKIERDLITNNYKAEISFADRKGLFKSNSGSSRVKFPMNQYIGYIDRFTWFMDKEEIAFSSSVTDKLASSYDQLSMDQLADTTLKGARFISIHPAQDSLDFIADYAVYSRQEQTIKANGVRVMHIADAAIFPDNDEILIKKRAEIQELENASILANTTTQFHQFNQAVVNIKAKNTYFGRADYEYIDKNDEVQLIFFNEIAVNDQKLTFASAEISQDDEFTLSPAFRYAGEVQLLSTEKHLTFDGGFAIRNLCDTMPRQWVKFKSVIIPDSVSIPIDTNMLTIHDRPAMAAIKHAKDQKQIYSSFFSYDNTHRLREGNTIFTASGYLVFDELSSEYRIASAKRLQDKTAAGNYTAYNTRDCIHYGEGAINFFGETGQVELTTLGDIEYFVQEDSTLIKGTIAIDFHFEEKALEYMAQSINSYNNLKGVELNSDRFKKAVKHMLDKEQAEEVISEISLYNRIQKLPEEMEHTMILTDVSLSWDDYSQSFISTKPVGIAFIGDEQVTKYVDAYMVFNKGRRGGFREGEFTMLLEISTGEWYYFNYRPTGSMTVVAASDEFKTIISEVKSKDREMDTPRDETPFRYNLGGSAQREQFLRNIERLTGER